MSRYIDANALLAWYDEIRKSELEIIRSKDYNRERKAEARIKIPILDKVYFKIDQLKSEAADVVEVVRCKDCKFRFSATCMFKHETADMDYCSCGAKMDGGKE